jgi:hypothetical protein
VDTDPESTDTDPESTDTNNTDTDSAVVAASCEAPADLPADPLTFVGKNHPSGLVHLTDLSRDPDDGRFYSVGAGGFFMFEATADNPTLLGKNDDQFERHEVEALGGGYVAVASRDLGFAIMDVSDPDSIDAVAFVDLADVSGLAALGNVLYVLTHTGDLRVYDIGNKANPTHLLSLSGLGNPWDMEIVGARAYVADNSQGVVVVDLSDPELPVIGEAVAAAGAVQDVAIEGDFLYAAVGAAGIEVFSLATPDAPSTLGSFEQGASVISVDADAGYLWAAEIERVQVFDLSSPSAPLSLAIEPTDQWAMHVSAEGANAWVAAWGDFVAAAVDADSLAPDGDAGRTELYFADATEKTFELANRGASDLVISGLAVDDDRFSISVDQTTIAPGDVATVTVEFESDGEDAETELCIATNDPNEPLQYVLLATGSTGSESIAVGESAIDFTLDDLDGESHHLADQLGHPVVLVYFATW